MKLAVFLLAQGAGDRWHPQHHRMRTDLVLPTFKQCLPIKEEPLIIRSRRLLDEFGVPPSLVRIVASEELFNQISSTGVTLPYPGKLLEAVAQCTDASPFADELVFLLGDVLFSRHALATLFSPLKGDLRFLGRLSPNRLTGKAAPELFGFRMAGREVEHVRRSIASVTRRGETTPAKLWNLWDAIVNPPTVEVNDYTDDVDSPEEYRVFWKPMRDAALEDE